MPSTEDSQVRGTVEKAFERPAVQSRLKLVARAVAYFVLLALVNTVSYSVVGGSLDGVVSQWQRTLAEHAVYLAGVVGLTWAFCRFLDRSSLRELDLQGRGWLSRMAAGWSLGTLLQFLVFLVLLLAGWLTVRQAPWQPLEFAVSVLAWIVISFNEELAFRGYILQRLMPGVGVPAAVILSSLVFAAVHVLNPNVQVLAIASIFVAGLLLATAYLVSRSLWLPIGLHIGWNLAEIHLFGFAGSGVTEPSLLRAQVSGPEVMTGGAFGPEGGIVGLAIPLLGIAFLLLRQRVAARETKI